MIGKLRAFPLTPGSALYRAVFTSVRLATRCGLYRPNTRIHCIAREDWLLVLTPLAGSSSVRRCAKDVSTFDLLSPPPVGKRMVYIMTRDHTLRMTSFYNKKVRNPTSVGKAALLATCPPLDHETTPDEFLRYLDAVASTTKKDKHLYSFEQLCSALGRTPNSITALDIGHDRETLEALLGVRLDRVAKSTADVATFAEPLPLPLPSERQGNRTA